MSPRDEPLTSPSSPVQQQVACPLCRSTSYRPWLTGSDLLYGGEGTFQVVQCRECRHVYLNPRLSPDSLQQYYPVGYMPHHQSQHSHEAEGRGSSWKAWFRRIGVLRHLVHAMVDSKAQWIPPSGPSATALEVGCAHGAFLEQMQRAGWQVEGLEISAAAVAQARSRGLTVCQGRLEDIPPPANHYDAIFLWMVLEHLAEPVDALEILRRSIKPDGWLIFSVPNVGCWEPYFFGRFWHAWDLPRHLQHFSPRTIRQLLAKTGFSLERIIYQRTLLNLTGSLGLFLRHRIGPSRWGQRLLEFTDNPTAGGLLLLAPLAKVLAWSKQAGRLTVIARPATPTTIRNPSRLGISREH